MSDADTLALYVLLKWLDRVTLPGLFLSIIPNTCSVIISLIPAFSLGNVLHKY